MHTSQILLQSPSTFLAITYLLYHLQESLFSYYLFLYHFLIFTFASVAEHYSFVWITHNW